MPKRAKESELSEPDREPWFVKVVDPLAFNDSPTAVEAKPVLPP